MLLQSLMVSVVMLNSPVMVEEDGFRVIFDGKTLDGWKQVGPGSFEKAEEGFKTVGGMGLLYYEKETFGDCVIRVVYKVGDDRDNAGVYVRIAEEPDDPWYAVHNGYEVQIVDRGSPLSQTGAIYSFSEAKKIESRPGAWNTMEITLDGEVIAVSVNGEPVSRFDPTSDEIPPPRNDIDPKRQPRKTIGYIGLQNHGDDDLVYFKEVSIKPLKAEKAGD
ncbi:3-keto-disaccharide hydrolase [Tautonia rosea]|uniref:3-keto-disaccharide hydrolase n=1 Tax=Tautonia rosea TaxID=2728037 RepID=UPI0014751C6B|nr:DUF1080 domain-containing protein [Tautonia rosea]